MVQVMIALRPKGTNYTIEYAQIGKELFTLRIAQVEVLQTSVG